MSNSERDRIKRRLKAIDEREARLTRLEGFIVAERPKLAAERKKWADALAMLDHLDEAIDEDLVDEIGRLFGEANRIVEGDLAPEVEGVLAPGNSIPKYGTSRPANIPTTAEMIDLVLADAEAQGKAGLVGIALVAAIGKRWWPGVGSNSILPTAAALVDKGRLARKDRLFVRVKKPKTETAGKHTVETTSTH